IGAPAWSRGNGVGLCGRAHRLQSFRRRVGRPAFLFWPEGQDTDPAVPRRWSVSLGHPALDRQQFQTECLQQLAADGATLAATTSAATTSAAASAASCVAIVATSLNLAGR